MAKNTIGLPLQGRAAEVRASSYDEGENTIEVVWTTGASVRRYSWREGVYYDEVLEVSASNVRLGRLNAGAPLLDTHDSYELKSVIGSVVEGSAKIEGGRGVCKVRLSQAPEHAGIVANIRAGVIRNISVGYAIHEVVKTERGEGEIAEWRVVDWEPMEISAVPIPADAGSQFRDAGGMDQDRKARTFPVLFRSAEAGDERDESTPETQTSTTAGETATNGEGDMHRDTNTGTERAAEDNIETRGVQPAPGLTDAQVRAAAETAVREERKRAGDIRDMAKRAGEPELGEQFITDGKSVDEFRTAVFDKLIEKQGQTDTTVSGTRATVIGPANAAQRAAAVENALLHRISPAEHALTEHGRNFRGYALFELARQACEAEGVSTTGMSRSEVAAMALRASNVMEMRSGGLHSTSDFPIILANVVNKLLRAAYDAAPQTFRPLVQETTVPDFKVVDRVQIGEAPKFERVNEAGEFKRGTIGEAKESYRIATYGKVVGVTRQLIINDDLNALARLPRMFGIQYANLESDIVWAQIIGNPVMGDGQTLFHASHGNLGSAAAIGAVSVAAGFQAMRMQKGLDNSTLLNITPSYLIAPVALQMTVSQFLTTITPNQTSQVVPEYLRGLTPITEPRLDGGFVDPMTNTAITGSPSNWYLAASPGMIDTVELAYLEGNRGVYTENRLGFDSDGVEIKVRADIGAKAIDWRAFYRNPN